MIRGTDGKNKQKVFYRFFLTMIEIRDISLLMESGIYRIINIFNNHCYIGSAKNIATRKNNHFYELRENKHGNSHLQNAFNLYMEDNFVFDVLEFCSLKQLVEREQFYMDTYRKSGIILYNIRPIANTSFGVIKSEETRKKIGEGNKGKYVSEETRRKLSQANKGKHRTEEQIRKHSESMKGRHLSEEHKKRISEGNKGKERLRKQTWGLNLNTIRDEEDVGFKSDKEWIDVISNY